MKMPIPQDWDGQSTCDFAVRWPNSNYWRLILRGLITNPSIVDFWDANTGDISQVLEDFQPIADYNLESLECGAMQIPIGTVLEFAGLTLPDKFLWADGSLVAIADEQELFDVIGYSFAAQGPEVEGFFYLPDRKGRVAVGPNPSDNDFNSVGVFGGSKSHTLTINEMPPHTHLQDPHAHTVPGALNADGGTARRSLASTPTSNVDSFSTTAVNQNSGGGSSHNNLQPYIVVNFIIRART